MLKASEVAQRLNITNSQVQDLVDFGYLPVADTYRLGSGGFGYLFAEQQLDSLNVSAILADIKEKKQRGAGRLGLARNWQRQRAVITRHDSFLRAVADLPESRLLYAAYYLFHLNHYAKAYPDKRQDLYVLKNKVLSKMVQEYRDKVHCLYLVGGDRVKIWLCEDCREAARAAGYTYPEYLKEGHCCEKCYVQVLEREYYSLIEFSIQCDDYRFCFHLPYGVAKKWLDGIEDLPRKDRGDSASEGEIYFYGRRITRVEEKVVPLQVVIRELKRFIEHQSAA